MLKKFVWDTSALLNIKEPGPDGYSPGYSLFKDLRDGWISGPYQNIFPAHSIFELQASISRKHREGNKILRDYYIMGPNERIYDIDEAFIQRARAVAVGDGFNLLRGGDLIFACIAHLEDAYLVTLDTDFLKVASQIKVINLRDSITSANYRDVLCDPLPPIV